MSRNLNDLHPYVKHLAEKFIGGCKGHGIEVLIYCTYRSIEEQNKLYAKGRTVPGNKITQHSGVEQTYMKRWEQ
ncbi:M15 family metallopeptidase domain-containing protein [Tepidibacter aestuarii]|uniref:D-alanyl-D-alanine carboxypeptidase family protein n=1 Tax=Tepidibacter aestuarii TaxID=2925782 RepID=UPI0020C13F61|nr:D-alanyl-D-alanine carboxypeptidase family protein [Tepidibacter aestuarii]